MGQRDGAGWFSQAIPTEKCELKQRMDPHAEPAPWCSLIVGVEVDDSMRLGKSLKQ